MRTATPLDGLTVIYHRPSGQTHVVSEPVPEILAAMGEDALDAAAVMTRLGERHEIAEGVEALEARLAELCESGLIARA